MARRCYVPLERKSPSVDFGGLREMSLNPCDLNPGNRWHRRGESAGRNRHTFQFPDRQRSASLALGFATMGCSMLASCAVQSFLRHASPHRPLLIPPPSWTGLLAVHAGLRTVRHLQCPTLPQPPLCTDLGGGRVTVWPNGRLRADAAAHGVGAATMMDIQMDVYKRVKWHSLDDDASILQGLG